MCWKALGNPAYSESAYSSRFPSMRGDKADKGFSAWSDFWQKYSLVWKISGPFSCSSTRSIYPSLPFLQWKQKLIWSMQKGIISSKKNHWIFLVSPIYKSLSKALLPVISDFLLCGRLSAWKAPLPSLPWPSLNLIKRLQNPVVQSFSNVWQTAAN